jgi:ACS family tartrate transporter-like MFS transporter
MDMENQVLGRVMKRIIPFLMVCYLFAFLDRVNIGFAALTMNRDLGISATAFGFAAGIFFFTYFLLEVPSNIALVRFGARRWIARIMITWGILSAATAFVQGANSLYFVRALLGAAEAGFFPGIIFYLTLWFPSDYRARIVAYFMTALPVSSLLGSPISALLLSADGFLGLGGWQILFIVQGIPSIILGFVVLAYLTDEPSKAKWLTPEERNWLTSRLDGERNSKSDQPSQSLIQTLLQPKVIALGLANFGGIASTYALGFFLPQIINAFGLSIIETGFVTAVPYIFGVASVP